MLSVIIPSRNERYLEQTIRNVLENARGEIEILAVLDGWLPEPEIKIGDDRVVFLHFPESIGQRQAINCAARQAKGKYIMKLDAHCAVDEGFDIKLAADCPYNWTVVPRMYNLDIGTFKPKLHKVTDYMYMRVREDGQFRAEYYTGSEYRTRHNKPELIDDTMCCMGPCFFMHKERFLELGGCDENHGGWGSQGIEVSCKAWLSGGALKVNKKTWFAHWFRGGSGPGFPYSISGRAVEHARRYAKDLWTNNKWPQQKRNFQWLLDKFNPPGWESQLVHTVQDIHRAIRGKFGVRVQNDFSPIGTKMGSNRDWLPDIWRDAGYKKGIEIGVWRGYFSEQILKNMPDAHLHLIDPWEVYEHSHRTEDGQRRDYQRTLERLAPYNGRFTVHKEFSQNVANLFEKESLDFIFIDGDHSFEGCVLDLINYVPKVRKGGMIAVHDYLPMRRAGVIEAVNGYTKCNRIEPWFVIREELPTAFWVKE